MSKPIATVGRHSYGIGYTVVLGGAAIIHVAEKTGAETIAAVINATFAETQAQRDCLLSTCDLMRSYLHLENGPQGVSGHMLALARHEVENAVNAAIARARGEVGS